MRVRKKKPGVLVCRDCYGSHASGACSPKDRPFNPWIDLDWEQDELAQQTVAEHPDGMTLEEIGAAMNITRERVRQIEAAALQKLKTLGGDQVATIGGHHISVPDCVVCAAPFIRRRGSDRRCEVCEDRAREGQRRQNSKILDASRESSRRGSSQSS